MRTRIAPTPSGYLHPGNGLSFILTWLIAKRHGGTLLLRIDDLDSDRFRPEYLEDIFTTLEWLGLEYDEGPSGPTDFLKNYSQHHRLELYENVLRRLRLKGLLFACRCTRKELREHTDSDRYPGICRELELPFSQEDVAWRIRVPAAQKVSIPVLGGKEPVYRLGKKMGDFVVRQKNGLPAYQVASLVDDIFWNIDLVVRGADLLESTAAQLYLARQADLWRFEDAVFWHHPLLLGDGGEKLSKSKGAGSLKEWREAGKSPHGLFTQAADWLGLSLQTPPTLQALLQAFSD